MDSAQPLWCSEFNIMCHLARDAKDTLKSKVNADTISPSEKGLGSRSAYQFVLLCARRICCWPRAVLLIQMSKNSCMDWWVSGLKNQKEQGDKVRFSSVQYIVHIEHALWNNYRNLTLDTIVGLHCLRVKGSICWFLAFCPSACHKTNKKIKIWLFNRHQRIHNDQNCSKINWYKNCFHTQQVRWFETTRLSNVLS